MLSNIRTNRLFIYFVVVGVNIQITQTFTQCKRASNPPLLAMAVRKQSTVACDVEGIV